MGVTVSSSHVVSAAPSSSGRGLLTLCPCSRVVSLSLATVLHKLSIVSPSHGLQLFTNCSSVGPFHGVQFFTDYSSMGPFHGVQYFKNRLFQCRSPTGSQALLTHLLWHGLLSLHGSTGPGKSLLQHRLPIRSQPPLGIHLLQHGVPSTGCRWISAPPWTSMGCRGRACLTMVFITGCKRKLSAPESRAPPPPPSSLTLVSAELFLSHRLTPLSSLPFHCSLFLLLKYVITDVLPPSLIGLALASSRSILEPAGIGSIRQGGSF